MASDPNTLSVPPAIAQQTGATLIGHLLNWGLFGTLTVQCYIYYLAFPQDKPRIKALVLFVYVTEVLHVILATRDAFRAFAAGWGNMVELKSVGLLWLSVPVLGSVSSCTGQLFYAWRIWILGRSFYVPLAITLISLTQGIFGIYVGVRTRIFGVFDGLQQHIYKPTCVWLVGTALCDLIVAIAMSYYLHTSGTAFNATRVLLIRIVRLTTETGLLCATFAIVELALFLAFENKSEYSNYLAPAIPLSKLYSNSLLVLLNIRVRMVGGRNHGTVSEDDSLTIAKPGVRQISSYRMPHRNESRRNGASTDQILIDVNTVSERYVDGPCRPGGRKVSELP